MLKATPLRGRLIYNMYRLLKGVGVWVVICWVIYIVAAGFLDGASAPLKPFSFNINILFAIHGLEVTIFVGAVARWLVVGLLVVVARRGLIAWSCRRSLITRLLYYYFTAREVVAVDKLALCNLIVYVAR